jgi:alpha-glucosidase
MDLWQDGINADRNANDFTKKTIRVQADSKQDIHLAPGGGWAAIIRGK